MKAPAYDCGMFDVALFAAGFVCAAGIGLAVLAWWLLAAVEDVEWDDDTEAEDRLTGGGW